MIDDGVFASLVTKIRSLDLDQREAAVLGEILRRSRDADLPEVGGFGFEVGSLGFDTGRAGASSFKGSDEELQALVAGGRGFKGTDEELQALVSWLRT